MTYIRTKEIPPGSGHRYLYEVRSVREGSRVRQLYVRYVGPVGGSTGGAPRPDVVPKEVGPPGSAQWQIGDGPVLRSEYVRDIGSEGTRLYVEPGVPPSNVASLTDSFERLPPGIQADVSNVEIYAGKGKEFSVGTASYAEGGHWYDRSKTIRIFAASAGDVRQFRKSDHMVAHEAGHATWDRFAKTEITPITRRNLELKDLAHKSVDYDALVSERQSRVAAIRAAYDPRIEAAYSKYRASSEFPYSGPNRRRVAALQRMETAEIQAIPHVATAGGAYEKAYERAYSHILASDPELQRLLKKRHRNTGPFVRASDKEGGLTTYASSYFDAKSPTRYTENFAEAVRVFYSSELSPGDARAIALHRPQTYRAFRRIMDREGRGHAIPLTKKPRDY